MEIARLQLEPVITRLTQDTQVQAMHLGNWKDPRSTPPHSHLRVSNQKKQNLYFEVVPFEDFADLWKG